MAISIRKVQEKKDPSISHWISRAYSHVFSAEACLCPRGTKCGRETMERTFITLLPFFFQLLLLLLEYQAGASAEERGKGHQKEKPQMTGVPSLRFSALCWLTLLTARREKLVWAYPLPRCSFTLRLFRFFFPLWKGTATYTKLPSFYASILSFYAKPNTDICQWSTQFYLQYPFVMNMYFGAFRFFK